VGDLQCGVLDWGGFRCRAISSHIHAAIFAGECHLVDTHHDTLLQVFVDACHEAGGPLLHMDELRLHVRALSRPCHAMREPVECSEWESVRVGLKAIDARLR
jgi:hypothetical protein